MTNKERRRVTINDQDYYIVGKEDSRRVEVTVYDDSDSGTMSDNEMVEVKESKKGTFGIRDKPARSLPEVMQDALSRAVESVDGEKFFRRVLIRDSYYSHSNDTLEASTCLKARGMSLEEQTMRTIDNYLSNKRSKERQIDNAVEKMDEVYRDDW